MENSSPSFNKVRKDGEVAVLYSPGYGAGWSTWADDELEQFMLFDSGLVALAELKASVDEVRTYVTHRIGEAYAYLGGWEDISVAWVPEGQAFRIDEYDGSESIVLGTIDYVVA